MERARWPGPPSEAGSPRSTGIGPVIPRPRGTATARRVLAPPKLAGLEFNGGCDPDDVWTVGPSSQFQPSRRNARNFQEFPSIPGRFGRSGRLVPGSEAGENYFLPPQQNLWVCFGSGSCPRLLAIRRVSPLSPSEIRTTFSSPISPCCSDPPRLLTRSPRGLGTSSRSAADGSSASEPPSSSKLDPGSAITRRVHSSRELPGPCRALVLPEPLEILGAASRLASSSGCTSTTPSASPSALSVRFSGQHQ